MDRHVCLQKLLFLFQLDGCTESYGKGLVQYVRYALFHGEDPLEFKQVRVSSSFLVDLRVNIIQLLTYAEVDVECY